MNKDKKKTYLLCPKKGNHKKHIDVCKKSCKKKCETFKKYLQPELPLEFI